MSDIGGFDLPGFETGGRKLRASGIIRTSNMLLTSRTLRICRLIHQINNNTQVDPETFPSYQLTDARLRGAPSKCTKDKRN